MRKPVMNLNDIKKDIMKLKGKYVSLDVNKGRNKIIHYDGLLEDIYQSVFVISTQNNEKLEKLSYSFTSVLCGDVKIIAKK